MMDLGYLEEKKPKASRSQGVCCGFFNEKWVCPELPGVARSCPELLGICQCKEVF